MQTMLLWSWGRCQGGLSCTERLPVWEVLLYQFAGTSVHHLRQDSRLPPLTDTGGVMWQQCFIPKVECVALCCCLGTRWRGGCPVLTAAALGFRFCRCCSFCLSSNTALSSVLQVTVDSRCPGTCAGPLGVPHPMGHPASLLRGYSSPPPPPLLWPMCSHTPPPPPPPVTALGKMRACASAPLSSLCRRGDGTPGPCDA